MALRDALNNRRFLATIAVTVLTLLLSAYLASKNPSRGIRLLFLLGVLVAGIALLRKPSLRLGAFILVALVFPVQIGTGTDVNLNLVTLIIPMLFVLRIIDELSLRGNRWRSSPTFMPMFLFLCAAMLSLLVGNVLWDPAVPRSSSFIVTQLAQWAILAFSFGMFWYSGDLIRDIATVQGITKLFLIVGGGFACLQVLPGGSALVVRFGTRAILQSPFWILLTAISVGQLLFNYRNLSKGWRSYLVLLGGVIFVYAFLQQRSAASNWVGVSAVAGMLFWLRFWRGRSFIVVLALIMVLTGVFFPSIYEFAGGDDEWTESGGSRLTLIERVVSVTLRNPITGLGPASYRNYAGVEPLRYGNALWVNPKVNSHNNYVDLFAHTGLLGLGLFLWFAWELFRSGWRLSAQHPQGFVGGYVNGMLAVWVGSLVLMMFADWMLPFVYNIGFPGFQASILVWLFLGGLTAIETMSLRELSSGRETA